MNEDQHFVGYCLLKYFTLIGGINLDFVPSASIFVLAGFFSSLASSSP